MHRLDLADQRRDQAREAAGGDDVRRLAVRPLGLDASHDPVHGVRRAQQHTRPNRLFRPSPDGARGRREVGRGELGGASNERVRRGTDAGHDHAAEEVAVSRDAVECRGGPEVDDDRVTMEQLGCGERVEDAVRPHLQRLFHIERDRQGRASIHDHRPHGRRALDRFAQPLGHGGHHRRDDGGADFLSGPALLRQIRRERSRPLVRRARGRGREPPVGLEAVATEQPDFRFGVVDVDGEEHGANLRHWTGAGERADGRGQ